MTLFISVGIKKTKRPDQSKFSTNNWLNDSHFSSPIAISVKTGNTYSKRRENSFFEK